VSSFPSAFVANGARTWAIWFVPAVVLAGLVGWEIDWGRHIERTPPTSQSVEPKPVAAAVLPEYRIDGGLAAHSETVDRTLFNATRRPAPVLAGDNGPRRLKTGQFQLVGTTVTGERNIAFLKETAGGKSRTVRQGDEIEGMKVALVAPDRVRLTVGDESEELVLKVAPGPKTTLAAAPPPPGAPATPAAQGAAARAARAQGPASAGAAQAAAALAGAGQQQQNARAARRAARAAAAQAGGDGSMPPGQNADVVNQIRQKNR
jgi:hypothetical protein